MTIQLSVTVWTVICFCLLMLILHNLLFKPILRVMDQRRERMEKAATKKAEFDRLASEQESILNEKKAAFLEAEQKRIKDNIETIRIDSKKAIEAAKAKRLHDVEEYRLKAETERGEILEILSDHAVELAAAFANSLTKE